MTRRGSGRVVAAGVAAFGLAGLLGAGGAQAADEIAETPKGATVVEEIAGSLEIGIPVSDIVGSVAFNVGSCDPAGPLNGVDGAVYDISKHAGHYLELELESTLDADVYFYTAECDLIDEHLEAAEGSYDDSFNNGFVGETERGFIPPEAAFAEVAGYLGNGGYVLKAYDTKL